MADRHVRACTEDIDGAVKDMILSFGLHSGARFTETGLAARCGVSRTPLREALLRLEAEQ